jgi:1-acyl-sn-glycerol-3-phosphate acyltransferase
LYLAGKLGEQARVTLGQRLALLRGAVASTLRSWVGRAARGAYVAYLGAVLVTLALPLVIVVWGLVAALPGRRPAFALARVSARILLRLVGCRMSVEGLEHLRGRGPFVLASNHASYIDSLVLTALLPLRFVFIAKREVRSWPVVGTFVRRARHPTVDRWDVQQSVADAAAIARVIRDGESVLFFPEGTFTAATGLRPFRLGAFETAAETGTPVAPLALRGTRRVLRDGVWLPRPGHIHLWIGPAIVPESRAWNAVLTLRERTAEAIAAHCGEPRLALVAGGPLSGRGAAGSPSS